MNPATFGLPHDTFRPYQLATLLWLQRQTGHIVLNAPTGSGKSSLAKSLTANRRVVSLVKTKSLQFENYGKTYDFDVLVGKSNYRCIHPKNKAWSCSDCLFQTNMNKCPFSMDCNYLVAKRTASGSNKASVNYAYYLATRFFRENPPQVLVMDECHLLPSIVLEHVGITINNETRELFGLSQFPRAVTKDVHFETGQSAGKVIPWVIQSIAILKKYIVDLRGYANEDDIELHKRLRHAGVVKEKLGNVLWGLQEFPELWFVFSGNSVLWDKEKQESAPGLIVKPFSARFHFPQLFLQSETTMMMSATIGNPEVFAQELGIQEYQFKKVPQVYSAPIYDMGCPRLNKHSTSKTMDEQASIIGNTILGLNNEWSGIIHVNAKQQAIELERRLSQYLGDRVVSTPAIGTDKILHWWEHERKRAVSNSVMIAWSLWEGVDLLNDNICIVAKIPYASLGNMYTQLRVQRNPQFYKLETAWKLVQGSGRIRRGRKQDYEPGANFVGIADGNYKPLLPYIDDDIKQNIVRMK